MRLLQHVVRGVASQCVRVEIDHTALIAAERTRARAVERNRARQRGVARVDAARSTARRHSKVVSFFCTRGQNIVDKATRGYGWRARRRAA